MILGEYIQFLRRNAYTEDIGQAHVVESLDSLYDELHHKKLLSIFSKRPKGLYILGAVGRGKTFLMDLFYNQCSVPKQRHHFHLFMDKVFQLLKQHSGNIDKVIKHIYDDGYLLCLDEFQVRDIGSAMILQRLFVALFEKGIVLVTTSNTSPQKLYEGGLHRDRFIPFLDVLGKYVKCLNIEEGKDYRVGAMAYSHFFQDIDDMKSEVRRYITSVSILKVSVYDHELKFDRFQNGVLVTSFDMLCKSPMSAKDYQSLVDSGVKVLFVFGVEKLTDDNVAYRFIHLIDVLYENKVELYLQSRESFLEFSVGKGVASSFLRTLSRLQEMLR